MPYLLPILTYICINSQLTCFELAKTDFKLAPAAYSIPTSIIIMCHVSICASHVCVRACVRAHVCACTCIHAVAENQSKMHTYVRTCNM